MSGWKTMYSKYRPVQEEGLSLLEKLLNDQYEAEYERLKKLIDNHWDLEYTDKLLDIKFQPEDNQSVYDKLREW